MHLHYHPPSQELVKVMVTMAQPATELLAQQDRRAKLRLLEENARRQRASLVNWIESHGLSEQVETIGAPNRMNLFFVCCTPEVAEALTAAPGVVDVAITKTPAEEC
jgi:hypothetical protein